MNGTPIPHNRPTIGKAEETAAINVLRSGWIVQGTAVENFEDELCSYLGLPSGSAVAFSSGTAALYVALVVLSAKDKTVAMPFYCCSALRHAATLAGANPLLVDSKTDSPNMDLDVINHATNIAVIPHLFGIPQKITNNASNIYLIEDCAQSLGAYVKQEPVGLQGHVGIFSFYATKLITSGGQGGMVVSKESSIIKELKDFRNFHQKSDQKNRFNFQMTDLQAAIGIAQLQQFEEFKKRREEIYSQYQDANLPLLDANNSIQPVRFRAILQTPKQKELIEALAKNNISAAIPIQESELFGPITTFPNAAYWTYNSVSLPIYPSLTDEEVKRIIRVVKQVL